MAYSHETLASHPERPSSGAWQTVIRSFGVLLGGEAVARAMGLIAIVALARRLEPEGFGLVTLGSTLAVWFSLVVDAGTEVSKIRDVARRPHEVKTILEPVLGLRLALSAVAIALFLPVAALMARSAPDRYVLRLFALALPALAVNLRWMVLGVGAWKAVAAGNATSQLLFAAGVLLLVGSRHDITAVPILQAGGELAYGLVVAIVLARRFGFLRPRLAIAAWGGILRAAFPLMVNGFARAVVYFFGVFFIARVLGSREAGLYGAAFRPVLSLAGTIVLFSHSFLASYSASAGASSRELFHRSIRASLAITVPIALVLSATAWTIVPLVYGQSFAQAAPVLAILAWWIPLLALTGPYSNVLVAGHRQGRLLRDNLYAGAFNIAGNLLMVPIVGIAGAAATTVISQLLVLALNHRSSVSFKLAPPILMVFAPRPHSLKSLRNLFRFGDGLW